MLIRSISRVCAALPMAALLGVVLATNAHAAAPLHDGPYTWDDSIHIRDFCAETGEPIDVQLDTHGWQAFTVWTNGGGEVTKILYRVRAPHDVFTNLTTGRQIVVRGEFQEVIERIPGSDEYMKTISGFRYLINEPGKGVVVQEVGRIIYADLEQTLAVWQAGKHDLVYEQDFGVFCDLLAMPPG